MALLFLILPLIFFGVPWFWKSWKSLMTWHVIVSIFINGCLLWSSYGLALGGGGGSAAAGAGGVAMLVILFMIIHLFSSSAKGSIIYSSNGGSLKTLPIYAIAGIVAYILIIVVIYYIGRIGASFIFDLDYSTLRKK